MSLAPIAAAQGAVKWATQEEPATKPPELPHGNAEDAPRFSMAGAPALSTLSAEVPVGTADSMLPKSFQPSMEQRYQSIACIDMSLLLKNPDPVIARRFDAFLNPNEGSIQDVKCHLVSKDPFYLISVGTERSLFDLILAVQNEQENLSAPCLGCIVQDINPKVKAYIDFVVLLIRLSSSHEELKQLAKTPELKEFQNKIEDIRTRLVNSNIPDFMKSYYTAHLRYIGDVYYNQSHRKWIETCPENWKEAGVDYFSNPKAYTILKQYADQGNISATVGSIGDFKAFSFTRDSTLVVDSSNCSGYICTRVQTTAHKIKWIMSEYRSVPVGPPTLRLYAFRYDSRDILNEEFNLTEEDNAKYVAKMREIYDNVITCYWNTIKKRSSQDGHSSPEQDSRVSRMRERVTLLERERPVFGERVLGEWRDTYDTSHIYPQADCKWVQIVRTQRGLAALKRSSPSY